MNEGLIKFLAFTMCLLFFLLPVASFFLPFFIVIAIMVSLSKGNKKAKQKTTNNNNVKGFTGKKATTFNKNVRAYFDTHESLQLTENISMQAKKQGGNKAYKLYVYFDGEKVCAIEDFAQYYPKTYNELLEKAYEAVLPTEKEVVQPVQEKPKKRVLKKDCAEYYINEINELITQITKSEITQDLYQTTAMLKQIDLIEEKYPESKEKLVKLYQYYLPILVDILEGYTKLVNSNSVHTEIESVELKLRKTIVLVNEALKTITMQLCEEEIIDMKSDMSVLESILRKDGLVKDGTMFAEEKSVK